MLPGIYLAEYGRGNTARSSTRFTNETLLSAPSIVVGLVVYGLVVARSGTFSGWAGVPLITVSILVHNVIARVLHEGR